MCSSDLTGATRTITFHLHRPLASRDRVRIVGDGMPRYAAEITVHE